MKALKPRNVRQKVNQGFLRTTFRLITAERGMLEMNRKGECVWHHSYPSSFTKRGLGKAPPNWKRTNKIVKIVHTWQKRSEKRNKRSAIIRFSLPQTVEMLLLCQISNTAEKRNKHRLWGLAILRAVLCFGPVRRWIFKGPERLRNSF